jgi:hypothetical protein
MSEKQNSLYFDLLNGIKKSQQIHIPEGNTSYDQVYHSIGQCVKTPEQIRFWKGRKETSGGQRSENSPDL